MGTRVTYAVQWKADRQPWAFYTNWEADHGKTLVKLEQAMQYEGCHETRILKRTETLEVCETARREVQQVRAKPSEAGLRGRGGATERTSAAACALGMTKKENRTEAQRSGFGSERTSPEAAALPPLAGAKQSERCEDERKV